MQPESRLTASARGPIRPASASSIASRSELPLSSLASMSTTTRPWGAPTASRASSAPSAANTA